MNQGQPEKIRLTGIDTPEKAQAFGGKAKVFTADLVGLQRVRVEFKERDRYGRILGEVFLEDGRSLNREILKAGLAWWYRQYSKDQSLGILEAEAKNAGARFNNLGRSDPAVLSESSTCTEPLYLRPRKYLV